MSISARQTVYELWERCVLLLQLHNCWLWDTDGVRQEGGDAGLVGEEMEKSFVLK